MRTSIAAVLLLLFAPASFAALSPQYAGFANGPADLLLTKEERKQWRSIKTDDQAKAFIDQFWARRDPSPGTPTNEFLAAFEQRVRIADERFGAKKGPGSQSDRGKVWVLLGVPQRIRRDSGEPPKTVQTPVSGDIENSPAAPVQQYSPKEMWEYEQGKTTLRLGQPILRVAFIDQYATNDWKMERTSDIAVFESIAASYIVSATAASAPMQLHPAAVAVTHALTSESLRAAIEKSRGSSAATNLFLSYGEFITPSGEHFVPVQLYVPGSTGSDATFFGAIEKSEGGESVVTFEEPVALTATKGGAFYARSLSLPAGSYRGVFGLAKEGKPIAVASTSMTISGLDKDAAGISPLILSNHVETLPEAQTPTAPFSFGGLRVVPKSDGAFRNTDELWYFFEVRNPAVDPQTMQPRISVKLSVSGTSSEGKPIRMGAPIAIAEAMELKGVPGHWGVGRSLPLSTFRLGSYTLTVTVKDQIANRSWDLSGSFRIVE